MRTTLIKTILNNQTEGEEILTLSGYGVNKRRRESTEEPVDA